MSRHFGCKLFLTGIKSNKRKVKSFEKHIFVLILIVLEPRISETLQNYHVDSIENFCLEIARSTKKINSFDIRLHPHPLPPGDIHPMEPHEINGRSPKFWKVFSPLVTHMFPLVLYRPFMTFPGDKAHSRHHIHQSQHPGCQLLDSGSTSVCCELEALL